MYEEELGSREGKAYSWSPDSQAIAYVQLDSSPSPLRVILDRLNPGTAARWQRFPMPGDPNPAARLGVVLLGAGGRPRLDVVSPLRDAEYLLPQLAWTPDSRHVVFQSLTRAQDRLELRSLDVARAAAQAPSAERTILVETAAAWVNALGTPLFLREGRTFLWLSERGGDRHLFRCVLEDGTCLALTRGGWSVDRIVGLDEARGVAYFTAGIPSARDRQLHSVTLASGDITALTSEPGTHEISLSPDGRAFLDVYSTARTPPRVDVVTLPARQRRPLEPDAPTAALTRYDTGEAQWIDVRAADGSTLHGRLVRPMGAAAGPPRAAIVLVYGGPRGQLVRDMWSTDWAGGLERLLVAAGYVVWTLDNRGSGGRGRSFEAPLRGELGRTELADQLAGITHLRTLPYVDGRRLGICGISYGGYLALYAAVHAPDVFQAVAAGAPVTDWRCYDSIFTERYLGRPGPNGASYAKSAILGKAAALRAPLLLFHGTQDDNVHLEHSLALADELRAAGRPPVLELHGDGHTYRAPGTRIARDKAILAHFARHLAAAVVPD